MRLGRLTRASTAAAVLAAMGAFPGAAPAAFTNVERVAVATPMTSLNKSVTVSCPAGKRVMTAGADVSPGDGDVVIDDIRPNSGLSSVTVRALEDESGTSDAWFVAAYAICAPAPAGLVRVVATSAPSSAAKSVTATCPSGRRVLGTGADVTGANGQILLTGIRPVSNLTAVTVHGREDQTGTRSDWTLTAYAICALPVTGLQRVAITGPSDSSGDKVLSVLCPGHKVLVGLGGEINSPSGQVVLDALFADLDVTTAGFAAWEDDTGNPDDWSLTTYAICAARVWRVSSTVAASPGTGVGTSAACPLGAGLTGGGGELTGGLGQAWITELDPTEFTPAGSRRFGGSTRGHNSHAWSLSVYAICSTPIPGFALADETVSATSAQMSVTASCPAGTRVIGGGNDVFVDTAGDRDVMLQGVRPSADLTSVTATQAEFPGQDASWTLTAVALCAPAPPGLQLVTRTSASDTEEFKSVTASCPAGKHLLGAGGAIHEPEGRVVLDDVRPDAELTKVTASGVQDPTQISLPWSVSAYAVCVNR